MLTRSQVAQRLRRSLATVRRLEGTVLHPQRDARGVNRFDEDEVAALAIQLAKSGSVWDAAPSPQPTAYSHNQIERATPSSTDNHDLRKALAEAQSQMQRAERGLRVYQERVARVFGNLGRELVGIDPDLADLVIEAMGELD